MTDEIRHKIEAYLGGVLTADEALLFEKEMEQDPTLLEEVKLSKQINHHLRGDLDMGEIPDNEFTQKLRTYLKGEEAKDVRASIKNVQLEYNQSSKPSRNRNYLLIAATIALLLVSTLGYNYFNDASSEQLYAQYFTKTDLPSVINRDDSTSYFEKGAVAFSENDFKTAISNFEDYIKNTTAIDPSVYLYTGVAHLETDNSARALENFDAMISSNSLDSSKGLWFKALAYLKIEKEEKTRELLSEIVKDSSNFNYEKAKALLDEL